MTVKIHDLLARRISDKRQHNWGLTKMKMPALLYLPSIMMSKAFSSGVELDVLTANSIAGSTQLVRCNFLWIDQSRKICCLPWGFKCTQVLGASFILLGAALFWARTKSCTFTKCQTVMTVATCPMTKKEPYWQTGRLIKGWRCKLLSPVSILIIEILAWLGYYVI